MLRSGNARRAGGLATLTALLVLCFTAGTSAGATPRGAVTPTPSPTAPVVAARAADDPSSLAANPDSATIRAFTSAYVNVLANDKCNYVTPCTVSNMAPPPAPPMSATGPAGWTIAVTSTGLLQVTVPAGTLAGTYPVTYHISDVNNAAPVTGLVQVTVILQPTPDHYNPPQGSKFSHAFTAGRLQIQNHVLRTINSTPKGSQIRILTWSFNSHSYRNALLAAKNRGVSVQIILAGRSTLANSDLGFLLKHFGGNRWGKNPATGSWVFLCARSCRGTGGTMHSKVFLFSQAYNTDWVTMTGSGNLTDFAAAGQWNQIYTTTNNKPVYDGALKVFLQSKYDRPAHPSELIMPFPTTTLFFTPLTAPVAKYDFINTALRKVTCTGNSALPGGRTQIRIVMYTWRDSRGAWLSQTVRNLWNHGCDVRIIYSIMSNGIKQVLYSPAGRGRIPMRQTLLVDRLHQPVWYLHNKYLAIAGNIAGAPNSYIAYEGSFNFSDLGMHSDDNFQSIPGAVATIPYFNDFNSVWRQRETRAPNPNSYVMAQDRVVLGQGRYQYMEPD